MEIHQVGMLPFTPCRTFYRCQKYTWPRRGCSFSTAALDDLGWFQPHFQEKQDLFSDTVCQHLNLWTSQPFSVRSDKGLPCKVGSWAQGKPLFVSVEGEAAVRTHSSSTLENLQQKRGLTYVSDKKEVSVSALLYLTSKSVNMRRVQKCRIYYSQSSQCSVYFCCNSSLHGAYLTLAFLCNLFRLQKLPEINPLLSVLLL